MLKVLVALLLVSSAVQCSAACTPCPAPETACPHHRHGPPEQKTACSHQLIPATTVSVMAMNASLGVVPAPVVAPATQVSFGHETVEASSPPIPPILVLRI